MSLEARDCMIVSIIGCSGHRQKLSAEIFYRAKHTLQTYIKTLTEKPEKIILRSGGSSGIDHLAVLLFLEGLEAKESESRFKGLILNLPCGFNKEKGGFISLNKYDNKAATLIKELHTDFSREIKRDSIDDLDKAIKNENCTCDSDFGFFKRNDKVAECDLMLAMTFGKGNEPTDSGTKYTWTKSKCQNKLHFHLA